MESDYIKIINYFGVNNQQRKLQEEVFELQEAITKFENGIGDIKEVEEELVDVIILIHQLIEFYEVDPIEFMKLRDNKLNRTIERINNGYYN